MNRLSVPRGLFLGLMVLAVALTNLTFTVVSPRLDWFDEGSALYASRQIAQGDVLYRDQLYYKMPLSYYLLGLVYVVTGPNIVSSRIFIAIIGSVISLLTVLITSRILPFRWALFLGLLYQPWTIPLRNIYHNGWIALLCILGTIYTLFRYDDDPSPRNAFPVGFMLGLTILAKQVHGFFTLAAIIPWCVARIMTRRSPDRTRATLTNVRFLCKTLGMLSLGSVVVLGLTCCYFGYHHALRDFWYYVVIYPLFTEGFAEGIALPFPWTMDLIEVGAFLALPTLYGLTLLYLVFSPGKFRKSRKRKMAFIVFLGISTYGTLFPRADFKHLLYSLFPGFLCLVYLAQEFSQTARVRASGQRYGFVVALLLLFLTGSVVLGSTLKIIRLYETPVSPLTSSAGFGISTSADDARIAERSLRLIHRLTSPSEPLYVGPWAPLLYILSQRQNPTRLRMFTYGHFSQSRYQEEIACKLEQTQTPLIIWVEHDTVQQLRGPNPETFATELRDYISENYNQVAILGDFLFYQRIALPGRSY